MGSRGILQGSKGGGGGVLGGSPEVVQKVPADLKNSHKYPKSDLQNSGTFRCFLGEQPENTENKMKTSENI